MIKTKIFFEGFDEPSIDIQINKWIAKHVGLHHRGYQAAVQRVWRW